MKKTIAVASPIITLSVAIFLSLSPVARASNGLVAHWDFEEGSGSVAADYSGNGHDLTLLNSPAWVAGEVGTSSLQFDATTHQSGSTAPIDLSGTDKITVSMWIDQSAYTNDNALALEISPDTNDSTVGGFVDPNSATGYFEVSTKGNAGYNYGFYDRPTPGWHHIVMTTDRSLSADEVNMYVDGVLQTPVSRIENFDNTNNFGDESIFIGSRSNNALFYNGAIDDVRLYDRILSDTEISNLHLYNDLEAPATTTPIIIATSTPPTLATSTPIADPVAGTYSSAQNISLTDASSTSILYTIDGSVPTCSIGTTYSSAIAVNASTTIQAIACYDGGLSSDVGSFAYDIEIPPIPPATTTATSTATTTPATPSIPVATPDSGTYSATQSVTLTSAGETKIVYTTDSSLPDCSSSTVYAGPIEIDSSTSLDAVACVDGGSPSDDASYAYDIEIPPPAPATTTPATTPDDTTAAPANSGPASSFFGSGPAMSQGGVLYGPPLPPPSAPISFVDYSSAPVSAAPSLPTVALTGSPSSNDVTAAPATSTGTQTASAIQSIPDSGSWFSNVIGAVAHAVSKAWSFLF